MFGECFRYPQSVLKMISHNSGVSWSENLLKKWKKSDLSTCSKIGLEDSFKRYFYVSFDIFISTGRTTLIFLPMHSLMLGKCFRYPQRVLKMISHNSGVSWSESLLKKWKKSDLSRCFKIGLEDFFKRYFYVSFDIFISTSRTTLIFT